MSEKGTHTDAANSTNQGETAFTGLRVQGASHLSDINCRKNLRVERDTHVKGLLTATKADMKCLSCQELRVQSNSSAQPILSIKANQGRLQCESDFHVQRSAKISRTLECEGDVSVARTITAKQLNVADELHSSSQTTLTGVRNVSHQYPNHILREPITRLTTQDSGCMFGIEKAEQPMEIHLPDDLQAGQTFHFFILRDTDLDSTLTIMAPNRILNGHCHSATGVCKFSQVQTLIFNMGPTLATLDGSFIDVYVLNSNAVVVRARLTSSAVLAVK